MKAYGLLCFSLGLWYKATLARQSSVEISGHNLGPECLLHSLRFHLAWFLKLYLV